MSTKDKYIDLHIHSTMSDGSFSPDEIITLAKENDISTIAITDHNTFEAVEDAMYYGKKIGIEVIAGAEISIDYALPFGLHGLAYFFDERFLQLQAWLADLRCDNCVETINDIASKLSGIGIHFSQREFAKFLKNKPLNCYSAFQYTAEISDFKDAFSVEKELFSYGKECYIEGLNTPLEVCRIIKDFGGKIFLAHPFKYGLSSDDVEALVMNSMELGFDGIEVYHGEAKASEMQFLQELALKNNILASGGSDFHGEIKPNVHFGQIYGQNKIPYSVLEKIKNS